jgi:uncharacterized membrane protein
MKNFIRKSVALLLFPFLILLFSGMFLSCASSKKHKQKTKTETTTETKKDSIATTVIDATVKATEQSKTIEQSIEECFEVAVTDGEELEIINFDANGNKTGSTKYKGSGNFKTAKAKKSKEISNEKESLSTTNTNSKTELLERIKQSKKEKEVVVNKEKKGISFCTYLFCIILLIIAVVLWYLNKRFKWIF